jgi:hypothetical protein
MATALSALLVSGCYQSLVTGTRACEAHNIHTNICSASVDALETLKQKKFELLILDFDLGGAEGLLASQAKGFQGCPLTVVGLSANTHSIAEGDLNSVPYWVAKPFSEELMARTLRAAYTTILLQRRSSFRHSVTIDASVVWDHNGRQWTLPGTTIVDVSQTGLGIACEIALPQGATASVDFQLPGTDQMIHAIGTVMWSANGMTGLQFTSIPSHQCRILRVWLDAQCPWQTQLAENACTTSGI